MKKRNNKKPFFASFLEKQIQNPEEIQGGATNPLKDMITIPERDAVTSPSIDGPVTLKYPSDSDDDGYDPVLPGVGTVEP